MVLDPPHQPVLLQEVITALAIDPNGIYIDGTFGRGGHSGEILKHLNSQGRLICFDKDPAAIAYGRERFGHDLRVLFFQACFSELVKISKECEIYQKINGILLDLGVSSPQLDEDARGFSFRRDGPLDMRMDPTKGISASEWLNTAEDTEIAWVLKKYAEETHWKRITRKIVEIRQKKPITTTIELAELVAGCMPFIKNGRHPATKTFQGIRIHINQELQAIDVVLQDALLALVPQGRLAMISFHSLEDRKVKQFFRAQSKVTLPAGIAIPEKDLIAPMKWLIKRQCPEDNEIANNPRARSATLRVAQKIRD
jgi:16S rRNA (cytosine1402-N4)-methyltransferase